MEVHLPLKPGHPPLHPNGDLRLLSHKLAHVHPLHSCLTFLLSDKLMELNMTPNVSVVLPNTLQE